MFVTIVTVVTSIVAALFAVLSYVNQVKTKINFGVRPYIPNNNPLFGFDSLKNISLWVSNIGYKAVTIIDVCLIIGKEKISLNNFRGQGDKIKVFLSCGETKDIVFDRYLIIQIVTNTKKESNDKIIWLLETNYKKHYQCIDSHSIDDCINVNCGESE